MAKGYILFTEAIHDPAAIEAYVAAAGPLVMAAGGTALIGGPPAEIPEGEWHGDTTVLLEFDSVEAARSWYHGEDYQSLVHLRHAAATSRVAIFAGF